MKPERKKLTLDQTAVYRIEVQGRLDESWSEWTEAMSVEAGSGCGTEAITALTGAIDQAALQGLLRRLYSLGLPVISVKCLDINNCMEDENAQNNE